MRSSRPSTRKDKYLIILTIVMIFAVAGAIVLGVRAFGGDKPAPLSVTSAETTSTAAAPVDSPITRTPAPATSAEADTSTGVSQAVLGIRQVDWPSVTGAAAGATAQGAAKTGFVESVLYRDLNGDGAEEALVLVRQQGSGQYLNYYVYAMGANGPVALFERRDILHGKVELGPQAGAFTESEPVYGPQDPNCCPSNVKVTSYAWSGSTGMFVQTSWKTEAAPQT